MSQIRRVKLKLILKLIFELINIMCESNIKTYWPFDFKYQEKKYVWVSNVVKKVIFILKVFDLITQFWGKTEVCVSNIWKKRYLSLKYYEIFTFRF